LQRDVRVCIHAATVASGRAVDDLSAIQGTGICRVYAATVCGRAE
jgi:hypothetical protein